MADRQASLEEENEMLSYLLAMIVGATSFGLYMAAFVFPEVYRRYDLIWSGVGLFYALVLWVCAERITGGLLLGQIASVALLGWFGYQTLHLRREHTPIEQRTPLPASAHSAWDVAQITVQQLRASFRQSADRSPLAAQLEHLIVELENLGRNVRSRVAALMTTTLNSAGLSTMEPSDLGEIEPYAEWDDLDPDSNPDMETSTAPMSQPLPDHSLPDHSLKSQPPTSKQP